MNPAERSRIEGWLRDMDHFSDNWSGLYASDVRMLLAEIDRLNIELHDCLSTGQS